MMGIPVTDREQSQMTLWAKDIYKSFGSRSILKGVSLKFNFGEAVAILGPNGAGKTTMFNIITGLIRPDHGTVNLGSLDITSYPMFRRAQLGIGYLPQEPSIFRGLSTEDNILAILELTEPSRKKRKEELELLLEEFSITHVRKSASVSLSGGERRRLEIARALAAHPKYILLDEPLAAIDPIAVNDIRILIGQLKNRGIGVVITDHNVRETLEIVDRAYIIHDGCVLMEGTPSEIVQNKKVKQVYLGENFSL